MEIKIVNYNKKIKGNHVLRDINLQVESGLTLGIYGRNASGKTMLLRAVAGLILPTTGSVSVNGKAITQHNRFNDSVGIVIVQTELWPHLTALETLQYINSFNQKATQEEIIHWLEKVGLEPNSRKLVKAFSLGMKQKLALAQAFFFEPDLILLDEPTNALDEQSRLRIYNILDEFKQKGKTIIIASHIKEDLAICERVVEIDAGSLKIL